MFATVSIENEITMYVKLQTRYDTADNLVMLGIGRHLGNRAWSKMRRIKWDLK
jgi:hypothetical protein